MKFFDSLGVTSLLIIVGMMTLPTVLAQNVNSPSPVLSVQGQNAPAAPSSNPNVKVVNQADGTQVTLQTFYCPAPSALIKNGLYWGTSTGGWRSYSESFDTSVVSFIGAQWVGVNVGKMICLYKGNLSMSFPINVQNDTLSLTPSGALWGKDQGGYRNCHSSNVYDCPFVVKKVSVNMQEIYHSLDFFKGKPNPLADTNGQ